MTPLFLALVATQLPTVVGVTLGTPPPAHADCPPRMMGNPGTCYRAHEATANRRTLVLAEGKPAFAGSSIHLHLDQDGTVDGIDIFTGGFSYQTAALKALVDKFGSPTRFINGKVQNRAGASFDSINAFWVKPDYEVDFVGVAQDLDSGDISVSTTKLHQAVEREIKSHDAPL